jgi:hypothetical protein
MTRADCMEAADRLEAAKDDLRAATTQAEREDAREEINHWRRVLFLAGTEEDQ